MFAERKKATTPIKEEDKKEEEERWPLRNVVFIEDMRTVQLGKVLKVQLLFILTVFYIAYVSAVECPSNHLPFQCWQ